MSGATFCRFSGLTNNTPVNFSVIAINAVGASPPSEVSNSVIPSVPPSAPTNIVAVAGDGSATVSWTAASTNGGVALNVKKNLFLTRMLGLVLNGLSEERN